MENEEEGRGGYAQSRGGATAPGRGQVCLRPIQRSSRIWSNTPAHCSAASFDERTSAATRWLCASGWRTGPGTVRDVRSSTGRSGPVRRHQSDIQQRQQQGQQPPTAPVPAGKPDVPTSAAVVNDIECARSRDDRGSQLPEWLSRLNGLRPQSFPSVGLPPPAVADHEQPPTRSPAHDASQGARGSAFASRCRHACACRWSIARSRCRDGSRI